MSDLNHGEKIARIEARQDAEKEARKAHEAQTAAKFAAVEKRWWYVATALFGLAAKYVSEFLHGQGGYASQWIIAASSAILFAISATDAVKNVRGACSGDCEYRVLE